MSHAKNVVTPSLYYAGVSATLGDSGDVDLFACCKDVSGDGIANVKSGDILETELLQVALGCESVLLEVTNLCLSELSFCDISEAELNSVVAVLTLCSLLLNDGAGTCLDDSYGNGVSVFVENLCHSDFLTDNAFDHFEIFLLFQLLVDSFEPT